MVKILRDGDADGETYDRNRDYTRLNNQRARVYKKMVNHKWWRLYELSAATGDPEASISARIRDLAKPKFGGHVIEKRYAGNGLWEYRLLP